MTDDYFDSNKLMILVHENNFTDIVMGVFYNGMGTEAWWLVTGVQCHPLAVSVVCNLFIDVYGKTRRLNST